MKIDPGFSIILATVAGFIGKIIWDWFKSGRLEKGLYVKTVDCEKNREKCCLPQLKRDSGILESRLTAAEKRLDQGREDIRLLREDIRYPVIIPDAGSFVDLEDITNSIYRSSALINLNSKEKRPKDWTAQERISALIKTGSMSVEERTA